MGKSINEHEFIEFQVYWEKRNYECIAADLFIKKELTA